MPFKARRPAGGFRVMYEYASRLAKLGYSVHITYPLQTKFMNYRLPYWARLLLSYIEGFRANEWFAFDSRVTRSYVKFVADKYVVDADVVIATWWSTALDMGKLSSNKGKKINLIQGYEDWEGHIDLLHKSYDMQDVTNIVVAPYLKNIVSEYTTKEAILIPNAIDDSIFKLKTRIEDRDPMSVCMMYSEQSIKGSKYGLEALQIVKRKYPTLKVELFGIYPIPEDLPEWITYYRNPSDLCAIYNRNALFISNSFTEGMALTPMEAMASGCASILTNIDGHSVYGINGKTALLFEVKDIKKLVKNIEFLIQHNEIRIEIAKNGHKFIEQFSWKNAILKMNNLIQNLF